MIQVRVLLERKYKLTVISDWRERERERERAWNQNSQQRKIKN
jgi:hypothetical protein